MRSRHRSFNPDSQENLVLQFYADRLGINCFKGSEHNVFKRFQGALAQYNCENFVRLTGDNPMLPAEWLENYIDCHLCNRPVMTTSRKWSGNKIVERKLPKGASIDIISSSYIKNVDSNDLSDDERRTYNPVLLETI